MRGIKLGTVERCVYENAQVQFEGETELNSLNPFHGDPNLFVSLVIVGSIFGVLFLGCFVALIVLQKKHRVCS